MQWVERVWNYGNRRAIANPFAADGVLCDGVLVIRAWIGGFIGHDYGSSRDPSDPGAIQVDEHFEQGISLWPQTTRSFRRT